jgi:hypothetical protein
LDRITAAVDELLAGEPPPAPADLAAELLAAQVRLRRTLPGFRGLWFHGPPRPQLDEYDAAVDRGIAGSIHAALVRHYGFPDTAERRLRAELAVAAAAQLLNTAFRHDPQGDPRVLAETRLMLVSWLFAAEGEAAD